jgi:uncharacterized protein (DUF983 family)
VSPAHRRHVIVTALRRGIVRRCPNCGRGRLFAGWGQHLERCSICGLVYERNLGDSGAFTIIGDRLRVAAIVILVYFGFARSHPAMGIAVFVVIGALLIVTAPNRWGVGIALHYLSRIYFPDPQDPVPEVRLASQDDEQ